MILDVCSKTASDSVERDGVSFCGGRFVLFGSQVFRRKGKEQWSNSSENLVHSVRKDGLRDFAVFDSEYDHFRDEYRKYVFSILSMPLVLRDQERMVHLMSRRTSNLLLSNWSRSWVRDYFIVCRQ